MNDFHQGSESCNVVTSESDDHQRRLEAESFNDGIRRYRNQERELREEGRAGETDWGEKLIRANIEKLARTIETQLSVPQTRAVRNGCVLPLIAPIDPYLMATVTARTIIDLAFSPESKSISTVSCQLGDRILGELQAINFEQASPSLFHTVQDRINKFKKSPKSRTDVLRIAAKKYEVPLDGWTEQVKGKIGRWLFELFCKETGLVHLEKSGRGRKCSLYVEPAPELRRWIEDYKSHSEILHPTLMPMVSPPKEWTTIDDGGYLELRTYPPGFVKTCTKSYIEKLRQSDLTAVFSAVNSLQNTSWMVNRWLFNIADTAFQRGLKVGDTLVGDDDPLPPKPIAEDKSPEMRAWKIAAAEAFRGNKKKQGRKLQAVRTLYVAGKFKDEKAIYFPHQLDFRGRVYALPSFLNPQSSDLGKGLLEFSKGKPLGTSGACWLYVHTANCYGVDKVSYADRVAWVEEHLPFILAIAADPFCDPWWTNADSPWQFLAACKAIEGYDREGVDYVCTLPVSVDGTNNGLQHFAAMLRDESCGPLVNLVPGDKPQDIYQAVADKVVGVLERRKSEDDLAHLWLRFGITRKLCKRPVMIIPYGGQKDGIRQYIIESIEEQKNHPFPQRVGEAASYLRDIMWDAMNDLMPGPREAMKWLQEAARKAAKLNLPMMWTMPSGFTAQQACYPEDTKRVESYVLGKRYRTTVAVGQKPMIDKKRQAQSFSPNFVHSLDASMLVSTVNLALNNGLSHFACVHDSYGTHACDVDALQGCLRSAFVGLYSTDILADLKSQIDPSLNTPLLEPPSHGALDITATENSLYLFS